jgi:NTP pyrophosphatase (non-canonical NTP hydrolase)
MSTRAWIYEAIDRERAFQDGKWGDIKRHPHSLQDWVNIMVKELGEAAIAIVEGRSRDARRELLQVIAVGVAALEQHGVEER